MLQNVLTFFLLIAIMIAGAVITAVLVVVVAVRFTQDTEILVTSSLIGVWVTETIIMILRSRFSYNRKINNPAAEQRGMLFSKGIGLGFNTLMTAPEGRGIKPSPRIKEIDKSQVENIAKSLKKRYLVQITVFAVFFGFVMYNQKNIIVNSLANETQQGLFKSIFNSPTFFIRIGIAAIIVVVLIIRKIMQKHGKGSAPMPVTESQGNVESTVIP